MKTRRLGTWLVAALCAAGLTLGACSDDSDDDPKKKDLGVDQTVPDQAAPDQAAPDQAAPDQTVVKPDTSPPAPTGIACTKNSDCGGSQPFCDTAKKICVACLKNTDCAEDVSGGLCSGGKCTCAADTDCTGKRAWGSKCVTAGTTKRCGCAASTDCAKTYNGATCNTTAKVCTCSAGTDCKLSTWTVCLQTTQSSTTIKTCQKKCTDNKICSTEKGRKACDTTAGGCVACLKNADCAYDNIPWNFTCTTAKFCVECLASSDCTSKSLGNACDTKNGWCTCKSNTDCASNVNGKVCNTKAGACVCNSDSDCPTGKKCTRRSSYLPSGKFCH